MKQLGITVFECEQDEANVFNVLAPRFDVVTVLTGEPVLSCGAALVRGNTCVSVSHKSYVSEVTLATLQRAGVKYISTRSIGCDHIDMEAAKMMGISVGTATYAPDGVADYTLMLMLMAIRNAKHTITSVKKCDFRLDIVRGKELRDMTVGVIGVGRIGKAVMERLQGFGCRVLTYSRSCADCVPLQELLECSDIITLHAPLCNETYHMISYNELELMKQGAVLINTGRGALVDTTALIKTLQTGKLGGAALDVLEGEERIFYFNCTQKPIENRFLLQL